MDTKTVKTNPATITLLVYKNDFGIPEISNPALPSKQVSGISVSVLLGCLMVWPPGPCTSPSGLSFQRPWSECL